jgi:ACT domain-containing protein
MQGQTLAQEPLMAQIEKENCLTIDQAMSEVGVSRGTFYPYMNYLDIQRHKFPFDRRAYILKSDVERIKQFMRENKR